MYPVAHSTEHSRKIRQAKSPARDNLVSESPLAKWSQNHSLEPASPARCASLAAARALWRGVVVGRNRIRWTKETESVTFPV